MSAMFTVSLPDKALLIPGCSSGKMLGLLLGQLYVGPNSLWASFVTAIVQLMYCLVLCCVVALLACITHFFLPHQDLDTEITTEYPAYSLRSKVAWKNILNLHCRGGSL